MRKLKAGKVENKERNLEQALNKGNLKKEKMRK